MRGGAAKRSALPATAPAAVPSTSGREAQSGVKPSPLKGGKGRAEAEAVEPGDDWEDAAPAVEVPWGGEHIVEVYGLTAAVKTQHLEEFLAGNCTAVLRPVVSIDGWTLEVWVRS